ncbi:MAG: folylpolyglutamate synthase/dihydrofolate synthase family protein [Rikenellaceae bacterium]
MNYQQTLEYLFNSLPSFQQIGGAAYKPGLERISSFCKALDNPQKNFQVIHVAGTNGKGSTSHILASILYQAGYRVGLFTSPHLVDFRERIRVDGQKISERSVVKFVEQHRPTMEQLRLSFFEMTAAMAFDHFAQSDVEVAIIETGLGGRLDATNVVTPLLSVVTNVALEHKEYLGDTITKIAAEKAGIIKKGVPVVIGESSAEYNAVFIDRAEQLTAPIIFAQERFACLAQQTTQQGQSFTLKRLADDYQFSLALDLEGHYQRENIITVAAVVDHLKRSTPITISRRAYTEGVANAAKTTHLRGRWQKLGINPLTVCDTGHNPHSLRVVAQQIEATPHDKLYCVLGFAADKDFREILSYFPSEAYYIFTRPSNPRALDTTTLFDYATSIGLQGEVVEEVEEALQRARALATKEDMIFVGGSNFVVAQIDSLGCSR